VSVRGKKRVDTSQDQSFVLKRRAPCASDADGSPLNINNRTPRETHDDPRGYSADSYDVLWGGALVPRRTGSGSTGQQPISPRQGEGPMWEPASNFPIDAGVVNSALRPFDPVRDETLTYDCRIGIRLEWEDYARCCVYVRIAPPRLMRGHGDNGGRWDKLSSIPSNVIHWDLPGG